MWRWFANAIFHLRKGIWSSVFLTLSCSLHAETLQLAAYAEQPQAWQISGRQARGLQEMAVDSLTTPLGSVWKLFMFSYLEANKIKENPYRCGGQNKEEVYCCHPGESIERNAALVQSCGLYFEPQRWPVQPETWRDFWQQKMPQAKWLQKIENVKPEMQLPVKDLLAALKQMPEQGKARDVLLDAVVKGRGRTVLSFTAAQLRVKTFSWQLAGVRVGGFAGWTQAGIPVWAMSSGTSATVLEHWTPDIANWVEQLSKTHYFADTARPGCVDVAFFQRYPIKAISQQGRLRGEVRIRFENGTDFLFDAGTSSLNENNKKVFGRFTVNEYVARVIDREGAGEPHAAAQALAVAARTYLLQNADREQECLRIEDSSQTQRVSPEPPSRAAEWAANTTDGLIVDAPVHYHQRQDKIGQMSWESAVADAKNNLMFDAILYKRFPQAQLKNAYTQAAECNRFDAAENYLQHWRGTWGERIHTEPGYQSPGAVRVCRISSGRPYADRSLNTLFVRGLNNMNDQVTLAHEYCHLAFKYHPSTLNENYIEALARKLVMEP
ncbi:MAG TPA: DUF2300 domain-containing protein [Pseudomonadales bacterium]|nr:DUF2300 domain-containing protein [Pseudomonadales bacterium]